MQPDTVATLMENFKQLYAMLKMVMKNQSSKNGCVKKAPFCKSSFICNSYTMAKSDFPDIYAQS